MSISLTGDKYSIPGVDGTATCRETVENYCSGKNGKEVLWEFKIDRQCSEETTEAQPGTTKSSEETTQTDASTTESSAIPTMGGSSK